MLIIIDYMKLYNIINKKSIVAYLNLSIIIIIFQGWVYPSQLHVKINDPIYVYMDRLSTQGVLPSYMNATLPITRDYIAEMLNVLDENRDNLSVVDQKILDEFLADYTYELKDKSYFQLEDGENTYHPFKSWKTVNRGFKDLLGYTPNQEEHHLAVYQNKDDLIWLDIGGMARYEKRKVNSRLPYSYHFSLSVLLGNYFSIYSDADLYSMVYNSKFSEYPDEFKGGYPLYHEGFYGYDTEISFEYAHAYIQHSSNIGNIALKVEPLLWGNGKIPIILSDNVPPFAMLSWDKKLGNSKFSFFHGSILPAESDTMINGLITNESKYLVGHRWEITATDKLQLAFTEMLVYGGRDPELVYFLPPIFLWPVQHNMTSQSEDNILWFFEGQYSPINGFKLYGTFMIDELKTSEMFNDWFGNRWAAQIGSHVAGNIFSYPTDIRLEWTGARPWAYTHRVPLYGTYTHNGRCLGFEHGPNSQFLILENRWWINTRNRLSISFEQLKWGRESKEDMADNFDFGNDTNHNYSLANPEYNNNTGWLIGDIQTTQTVQFLWGYQLSNIIGLELGFAHMKEMDESVNTMSLQVNVDY